MKKALQFLLVFAVGMVAGGLASMLPKKSSASTEIIFPIQVGNDESWASAWDIPAGQPAAVVEQHDPNILVLRDGDGGMHTKIAVVHVTYPNRQKAGTIFSDGTCILYRFNKVGLCTETILVRLKLPGY